MYYTMKYQSDVVIDYRVLSGWTRAEYKYTDGTGLNLVCFKGMVYVLETHACMTALIRV